MLCFWLAYILTRPLGASLGGLLSQARSYGGFGLGTVYTSLGFLVVIALLVSFASAGAKSADEVQGLNKPA